MTGVQTCALPICFPVTIGSKTIDTLRVLCGWRYKSDIPSESKFSRVFKSLSELQIAQKTHEQFVKEYLSNTLFFYNASDATKIPLRKKPLKAEK